MKTKHLNKDFRHMNSSTKTTIKPEYLMIFGFCVILFSEFIVDSIV